MKAQGWGGRQVSNSRAYWAKRLPLPCCRCRKPVIPDPSKPFHGWHVDHWPVSREMGGTETWPAHDTCNLREGGKRGAKITNAKRSVKRLAKLPSHSRGIRGI